MARTEIFRKFEEQIQAIKSVARENQRVADVLEQSVENIPTYVITLATDLMQNHGSKEYPTTVSLIKFDALSKDGKTAFEKLKFNEDKLRELYRVICPHAPKMPESTGPAATPPPGKGSGKKE
jgi:hypothetical protein